LTNDDVILRSAATMFRAHGLKAEAMCAKASQRWVKRGDQQAADLWFRIAQAVRVMALSSRAREHVHSSGRHEATRANAGADLREICEGPGQENDAACRH
jgi:hypothetical protein